ncbi:MAG: hypothetical protein WBQ43_19005 [Terriglobales bacterium]
MPEETKHEQPNAPRMECSEFEALLSSAIDSEAMDGDGYSGLSPARKESFDAHRRICGVCGPLFADAQAGQAWLRSLEPVEPPAVMVQNILVATSGVVSRRALAAIGGGRTTPVSERVREWWDSFITPVTAFVRQPRFVMSFGMIFFSFSLGLSAMGVKATDVAKVDLRPSALRHAYNGAQIKVVKYYDNIRFVYEIESKLRELKRANTPAEPGPQPQKENRKNNTSGQPEQRQDRNYSQDYNQPVMAALRGTSPAVETTNRRFV